MSCLIRQASANLRGMDRSMDKRMDKRKDGPPDSRPDAWNPKQYNKFANERSQPFWDLATLVDLNEVQRWLDIGCGSGVLTRALHETNRLPFTLGIDASERMLEEANYDASQDSAAGLFFEQARIEEYVPSASFDVVFSNAALQWCENHEALFSRILSWLSPGGQLAVQMPVNFDHPSHLAADLVAGQVAKNLGLKERGNPVLRAEDYVQLLWSAGLRNLNVFTKVYVHPMGSARDVIEWAKGSLLTFYERQLSPDDFREFLRQYAELFLKQSGEGPYLYTFKRLLIYGRLS